MILANAICLPASILLLRHHGFDSPILFIVAPLVAFVLVVNVEILSHRPRWVDGRRLVAIEGANRHHERHFQPTHWFRLVRRLGWRNVELEISDDGLEIPDAEPIPVMVLGEPENGCYRVLFDYRGRLFYGKMLP